MALLDSSAKRKPSPRRKPPVRSKPPAHPKSATAIDDPLLLHDLADGVLTLTLNRPDKNNALSRPLAEAIRKAITAADRNRDVAAIVIAGAGKSFCAGADTTELRETQNAAAIRRHARLTADLLQAPRLARKPVLAAVQGYALGAGCGLAVACDIVVADREARLGYPEIRRGIVPALVMPGLVRRVGEARAFALASRAEWIGSPMARAIGLVDIVCAPGHAVQAAQEQARHLAQQDRTVIAELKQLLSGLARRSGSDAMETAYRLNVRMKLRGAKAKPT
ncbi:enoyl-CoA hydratase/isomerase family protein [Ferrovibrio sp.]|uniref:enoyl-CoA hydratase/isomerase family protein n=1 Tax=Ferrovibrio sp. TaxID=1917215 RepID=UPI003D0EE9B3